VLTTGFDACAEAVRPYTLERAEHDSGVPARVQRVRKAGMSYRRLEELGGIQ